MKLILTFFLYFSFLTTTILSANEKVVLQLKWFHQFQFAGYYAAKEKGFYDEVGLDVEIRQRDIKYNNIKQVIDGDAQYGIADSILLLYMAKKEPIVLVSTIFQHSPSVLISLKGSGVTSPYDLDNKNIIFYPNDTDGFSILAMFKEFNSQPNLIRERTKNDYVKLMDKQVDLTTAYLSNEPFYFKEKNIELNYINPMHYGFDLYGDILFTNKNELTNHPDRVDRFKKATLKGWNYALENKNEIISLIQSKYSSSKSLKHLQYEANIIEKMIDRQSVPLGYIDSGRLKFIQNLYKKYGLIKDTSDIKDFLFEDYQNATIKLKLTQEERKYLLNNATIKVQNMTAFPPYNFNENDEPLGYSVDYMKLIGQYLGVNIEFVSKKTWSQNLDMIKNDTLDVIPQIAKNEEREKYIGYSTSKLIDYITGIATKKNASINSFKDLKDKKLAVVNKTFLHNILQNRFPEQKLYVVATTLEGVDAVARGDADAIIGNIPTLEYFFKKNWSNNFKTMQINNLYIPNRTPLYMGVSKGNDVLLSIIDKVNSIIPYDKKLELEKKWITIENKNIKRVTLTKEDQDYLKNKQQLNMCINPNWMPFEKIEDGKHIGITAEYIDYIRGQLPIDIQLVKTKKWQETLENTKNKKCDFIPLVTNTNNMEKEFLLTTPYITTPLVLVTKVETPFISDINSITKSIGISKNFNYKDDLKNKYPNIKFIYVEDLEDGLAKVADGKIFAYIDSLMKNSYMIQKEYIEELKIATKIDQVLKLSMAVRNDEPQLVNIFNKILKQIPEKEVNKVLNKWLTIQYETQVDYEKIILLSLIFTIVMIIIIYKNNTIKNINEKMKSYIKVVDENVLVSSTDTKGIINYVSKSFCDISGYTKEELMGQNHNIICHEDMDKMIFEDLWETIENGKIWKGEIKNKRKDGSYYWVDTAISPNFDKNKNITSYTAIRHEITDKKKVEELSITDELTGLYNRRHFNTVFDVELNRARRDKHAFNLIMIDIDFFKGYNDYYGHQKGDDALESVGKTLKKLCKRASDIAFRLGGEEFAILCTTNNKDQAIDFAKLVNQNIESLQIEHKMSKVSQYITISSGLYTVEEGDEAKSSDEIYNLADKALYKAKETGRNKVYVNEK